jgi:hypothetical protein
MQSRMGPVHSTQPLALPSLRRPDNAIESSAGLRPPGVYGKLIDVGA